MQKNFFLIFIAMIAAYIAVPTLMMVILPNAIPLKYTVLFQIVFFLLPILYLASLEGDILQVLRINLDFSPKVIVFLLWGLAGLSVFSLGWQSLQKAIIPDFLSDIYQKIVSETIQQQNELVKSTNLFSFFSTLFFIAIIPAICEEFLFRAYLLQNLLRKYQSKLVAAALSALLFSLIHLNPIGMVEIFIIGLYLAGLFIATGSIVPGIIFHLLNNALVVFVARYGGNMQGQPYSYSFLISLILVILGLTIVFVSYKKIN